MTRKLNIAVLKKFVAKNQSLWLTKQPQKIHGIEYYIETATFPDFRLIFSDSCAGAEDGLYRGFTTVSIEKDGAATPIWGVFYNEIQNVSGESLNDILHKALTTSTGAPFRGPRKLSWGNFSYYNQWEGTIKQFEGREHITYNNISVHELEYNGGLLVKKLP